MMRFFLLNKGCNILYHKECHHRTHMNARNNGHQIVTIYKSHTPRALHDLKIFKTYQHLQYLTVQHHATSHQHQHHYIMQMLRLRKGTTSVCRSTASLATFAKRDTSSVSMRSWHLGEEEGNPCCQPTQWRSNRVFSARRDKLWQSNTHLRPFGGKKTNKQAWQETTNSYMKFCRLGRASKSRDSVQSAMRRDS